MRSALASLSLAVALAACGPVAGSGTVVTRTFAVTEAFDALQADGAFVVEVGAAAEWSVTVETDDNLVERFRSEVSGRKLRVWTDGTWTSSHPFTVRIGAPVLRSVAASGTTRLRIGELRGDVAEIVSLGASHVTVDAVAAKSVKVTALGTSSASVTGRGADTLHVRVSGASRAAAAVQCGHAEISAEGASAVTGPVARTAKVVATGATKVDLDVSEELAADATGTATVRYGGKPKVGGQVGVAAAVKPRE